MLPEFESLVSRPALTSAVAPAVLGALRLMWVGCPTPLPAHGCGPTGRTQGALDHPRSINIFVVGDKSDAACAG